MTEIENKRTQSYPSLKKIYKVDGKVFAVTRYFEGGKNLNTLMTETVLQATKRRADL